MTKGVKIGIGVGVVALYAGVAYFFLRKKAPAQPTSLGEMQEKYSDVTKQAKAVTINTNAGVQKSATVDIRSLQNSGFQI